MPIGAAWSASAVPGLRPLTASATVRRCSPATSCPTRTSTARSLSAFALWPAFPTSDYCADSVPSGGHRPTTGLPACAQRCRTGGQPLDGSHVHLTTDRRGWCPAFPLQPWPRIRRRLSPWPPTGAVGHPTGDDRRLSRRLIDCCPAQIHQVRAGISLEGVPPLVQIALHRSVLLAGPGSSGSADPSRRCRGCSHPRLRLQAQAAPSFTGLLRQPGGGPFQPTRSCGASWRTQPSWLRVLRSWSRGYWPPSPRLALA